MAQDNNSDVFYPGNPLFIKIVTPDEIVLNEPCDSAEIPGSEGYLGIMPGHSSLIANLKPGVIYLHRRNEIAWRIYIAGGFAEISGNQCTVLADYAHDLPDLDEGQALADVQRYEGQMATEQGTYERQKLQAKLDEAQMRLSVTRREFVKHA